MPSRSRITQSAHLVSLILIGLRWGMVMSRWQADDLQPNNKNGQILAGTHVSSGGPGRTDWMRMSLAEQTVGAHAVLHTSRHGNEVATGSVVATVLDLGQRNC